MENLWGWTWERREKLLIVTLMYAFLSLLDTTLAKLRALLVRG